MKYDPINKIMVEDNNKTKDSKTKDLERPYFDPLYKDTRRAVVREVQNYLSSNGYNNSVGKYDKVVRGVRSLLEKTLLQPGTDKFNDVVHREADRLLKKYNLTKDSNFDDAVKKYFDKFKDKSKIEVEKLVAKAKGNPAAEEAYKKYLDSTKTKDAFNKVDLKSIFGGTDRRWLAAKKGIKDSLAKANTIQELEKLYDNMSYTDYSDILDDYIDIWNEVGKYAQDKRRQCINELSEMRSEVFKKLHKLEKE